MTIKDSTQEIFTFQQVCSAFRKMLITEADTIVDDFLPEQINLLGELFAKMCFDGYSTIHKDLISDRQANLIRSYQP